MQTIILTVLRYTLIRWAMALGWTIWISIILIQSEAQPLIDIGVRPAPQTLEREIFFTTLHVIAFATMAGVWWWALMEHLPRRCALISAVIIAIGFGIFTESMQAFAPDRYPSFVDLLANVSGALGIAYVINRKWQSKVT